MNFFRRGLLFSLLVAGAAHALPQKLKSREFTVCRKNVKLEIARSPQERATGLMERAGIPVGTGMVFVFEYPQPLSFWMKNVPFDIDIGFFDKNGRLLSYTTMLATSPVMIDANLPRYDGPDTSLYAIEVPAGFYKAKDKSDCRVRPLP